MRSTIVSSSRTRGWGKPLFFDQQMTQPPDIDRIINLRLTAETIRRVLTPVFFLIFLLQHPPVWPAFCHGAEDSPCKTIRDLTEGVLQILRKPVSKTNQKGHDRLKKVWYVMLPHVDTCEMAIQSLPAEYLPTMTNSQKEEFTDIFSRLLVQAYSRKLDRYTKNSKFRLVFDEGQIEGGDALVKSRLITSKKEHVITFRLHQEREKWLIYDISYDAVSQLESYRAQLDQIGKKSAYDYQEVRRRIQKRLKPALRNLPIPQVKMRLWGVCQQ